MITSEMWARVEPVLEGALELAADERESYVRETCGTDIALRREVDRLLRSSDLARDSILESPAAELAAPLLGGIGRVLAGRYELRRALGMGSMGVVFLAQDRELHRPVALKFLPVHLAADAETVRRFRREARAASALDHPNIAAVHDIIEDEDGRPVIVMGFYEGGTLRELIERGPLSVSDALTLARDVARGLATAHAAGIVHRDIKPSNILVSAERRARILDFGVAKVAGQAVTQESATPGTVAYMSPEQTRGEEVDGRSDLWSLGVMLYEMLTGQRPFVGDPDAALIHAIRQDEPRALRELRPEVPPAVAQVVECCLCKEPGARPADATALLSSLVPDTGESGAAATLADHTARPRPRRRDGLRRKLHSRAAVVVGATSAALLLLTLIVIRIDRRDATHPAPTAVAVLPFSVRAAPELAYLGDGMVDLLSAKLDGLGALRTVDPHALLGALDDRGTDPISPASGQALAARFDAGSYVLGSIVEVGGRVQIQASWYRAARGRVRQANAVVSGAETELLDMIDQLTAQLLASGLGGRAGEGLRLTTLTTPSLTALRAYLDGEQAFRDGRYADAAELLLEAVEIDTAFALGFYRLSVAASWAFRADLASWAAERAVRYGDRLSRRKGLLLDGRLAYRRGDATQAERLLRTVVTEHPDEIEGWHQLGEVLFHLNPLRGRSAMEAAEPFRRAATLDSGEPSYLYHLAQIAALRGERDALERLVEQVVTAAPEGNRTLQLRALRAAVLRDRDGWDRLLERLTGASDFVLTSIVHNSAVFARDRETALSAARLLSNPRRNPRIRALGHILAAEVQLSRGRWTDARAELTRAADHDAAWAAGHLGLLAASPWLPLGPSELSEIRAEVEQVMRGDIVQPESDTAWFEVDRPLQPYIGPFVLGLLDLRLNAPERTDAYAAALERAAGSEPAGVNAFAALLRAGAAHARGQAAAALAWLDSAPTVIEAEPAVMSPFYSLPYARYLRATLLQELGHAQPDVQWATSFEDLSPHDLVHAAPGHLTQAESLEQQGDLAGAAQHYTRFLELWRDADREFQPMIQRAEQRWRRLSVERN